jgi:hypothetical protein
MNFNVILILYEYFIGIFYFIWNVSRNVRAS